MSISEKEFNGVARLAGLEFTPEEEEEFLSDFGEIISFAGTIAAETEGDEAKALNHVTAYADLRDDEIKKSLPAEKITSEKEPQDGYFTVKRVVK